MSNTNENENLEFARELLDEVDDEAYAAVSDSDSQSDVAFGEFEQAFERAFANRPVRQLQATWDEMYVKASDEERLSMEEAVLTIMEERGLGADEARHYFILMFGVLSGVSQQMDPSSGIHTHRGKNTQKRKHKN